MHAAERGAGRVITVGISALYHDAACAVLVDGRLVAAAQEERFSRRRFDPGMPTRALRRCLEHAGVGIADVDQLAYYEQPTAKLARQLWAGLPELPPTAPAALGRLDADRPYREIRELLGYPGPVTTVSHHEAHAASAFYASGFDTAALFTADAVGEWATTSYGQADGSGLRLLQQVDFPDSLGLLYSAITSYLGFAVNSDEYKVMGLAPYGRPRHLDTLRNLVTDGEDGTFRLDLRYFDFGPTADRMYTPALVELLGRPARTAEAPVEPFHEDLAASVQELLEQLLLAKVRYLHQLTGLDRLCYAGGVALNCRANSVLAERGPFREIFIQPAAGDAGSAYGAAALAYHRATGRHRPARLADVRLGPTPDIAPVRGLLDRAGVRYTDTGGDLTALAGLVADRLASGAVIGWYQGRMEFGPRALGSRSILADPRDGSMRDHINAMVKKRESFRPFAPAVVAERAAEFFELADDSPFMLRTFAVRTGAELPAVTHVDGSARVQTVDREIDPRLHALLTRFGELTGYPVLLNTSFNMRGEPIVCDPADALTCFVRAQLDLLVLEDIVIERAAVPAEWAESLGRAAPFELPRISSDVYTFV
jgi:carbamoyltransferase